MKQQLHFITLGVRDLEKMKDWYKNVFDWTPMKEEKEIVFFKLNGFMLSLFPVHELAKDIGIQDDGKGFKHFTLAINLRSEDEVNATFEELRKKGVTIIKNPEKVFWGGYSGYIADIENNYWEIAYNPFLEFDKDGNVKGHE